jgi:hypothetical protein
MPECRESLTDFGRVSHAAVVYTGLKAESLVVRGGEAVKDASQGTTQALSNFGEYSLATIRYAGLVSQSVVMRGGRLTARCVSRVTTPVVVAAAPVTRFVGRPISALASYAGRIMPRKVSGQDVVNALEDRVMRLEERLSSLERFGIRPKVAVAPSESDRQKELSSDRRAFLRVVLEENKLLRTN